MSESVWIALIGAVGLLTGALVGHRVMDRTSKRDTKVAETVTGTSAQDRLIDQLQEELMRYRGESDQRVLRLEKQIKSLTEENRGYRAFIGTQRDHMVEYSIPLPSWPKGLPR